MLPHHARREPRLPPRRLDFLFQEAARFASGVARAGIGEGATFVVGGAGGLAGFFAFAVLHLEIAQIAAGTVDRGLYAFDTRLDHAGAAHTGDAAASRYARRHGVLQPAHGRAAFDVRIVEAPRAATAVALAQQRAILRIARRDRGAEIVSAGPVERRLGARRPARKRERKQRSAGHDACQDGQAALPHRNSFRVIDDARVFQPAI